MTLLVKNNSGRVVTLEVESLLKIDGEPYLPQENPATKQELENAIRFLDGRVAAVEGILGLRFQQVTEVQEQEV